MIIDLNDRNIEVLEIKSFNKDNLQNFKRKYIKKQKYLSKEINRKEDNKKEILESITKLFEDL